VTWLVRELTSPRLDCPRVGLSEIIVRLLSEIGLYVLSKPQQIAIYDDDVMMMNTAKGADYDHRSVTEI